MKQLLIIAVILTLSGCANTNWSVGLAAHSTALDAPEYETKNPVGMVRGEKRFSDLWTGFFEHESMIFKAEEGYGYNKLGVMLDVSEFLRFMRKEDAQEKLWYETR